MSTSLQHKIVSFVIFNVLWLSAVAGRDDYLWLTVLLAVAQLGYSYWVAQVTITKMAQLFAVGLLLEAIAISVGAIDFVGAVFPLWLVLLWVGFAAMAPVALDWLAKMPLVAALLGAISGPFTYYVGIGFGAGTADSLLWTLLVYAVVWGLFMLFFCRAMTASPNERLVL
ncbi:DUF2878 domain-containing protein [Idiomarina sp.]|uniref:DUF2878 domain-containing protein n=1 Tax=Idiomarina sp. TaxID=1874361 RepID=UPI0025C4081A|nr:DUF2878 domain-containing protein [Idiomarina sp.]NQZ04494.1 DUF2878 domain-containing protein [Idiomarina sp.]